MSQIPAAVSDTLCLCLFGFCSAVVFHLAELALGEKDSIASTVAAALLSAICAFVCIYYVIGVTHARVMRWYMLAGMLVGALCYRVLLQRAVRAVVRFIACAVRFVLRPLGKAVVSLKRRTAVAGKAWVRYKSRRKQDREKRREPGNPLEGGQVLALEQQTKQEEPARRRSKQGSGRKKSSRETQRAR